MCSDGAVAPSQARDVTATPGTTSVLAKAFDGLVLGVWAAVPHVMRVTRACARYPAQPRVAVLMPRLSAGQVGLPQFYRSILRGSGKPILM
jgi:hypothetical protein